MHNPIKRTLIVTTIILAGVPLVALAQWTSAPANPPSGNIAAPINVGSSNQIKTGGLEVGSFISDGGAVITGNLGVGTVSPIAKLSVVGNLHLSGSSQDVSWTTGEAFQLGEYNGTTFTERFRILNNGNTGIGTISPGYKLQVGNSGDGTSVGANAYYYISDKALKTNVSPLTGSLANVLKLQGVSFNWKSNGEPSIGVIAQDIEKVYPELVNTDKTTGYKSVEYGNLVAPLIEAVKEQQRQIDTLKAEVEALKAAK